MRNPRCLRQPKGRLLKYALLDLRYVLSVGRLAHFTGTNVVIDTGGMFDEDIFENVRQAVIAETKRKRLGVRHGEKFSSFAIV